MFFPEKFLPPPAIFFKNLVKVGISSMFSRKCASYHSGGLGLGFFFSVVDRYTDNYKKPLQQQHPGVNTVLLQAGNMTFFKCTVGLLVLLVVSDCSWAEEKVRVLMLRFDFHLKIK